MNTVGIRATAYCLNFAPELALHYGGTPAQERRSGRDPGFLQALEAQAQTYGQAQAYAPNKTYIGAMSIDELQAAPRPWTEHPCEPARFGKFGEIMPEDELLGLMDICDVFDLIWLEEGFAARVAQRLARDPVLGPEQLGRLEKGHPAAEIADMVEQHQALPLYHEGRVVGCCRRAHDTDENLSAGIMLENLACKASGVLALLHLLRNAGLAPGDIDFVVECSEEAVGDALQRGGGFFLGGAGVCQGGDGRQDGVPDLELDGLVRCRIGVGDDMQPDQLPRQCLLPLHQCQRRKQRQGDGK